MKKSEWFTHTFSLCDLSKLPYSSSIKGQIETNSIDINQGDKTHYCCFIGKELETYDLDFLFNPYIKETILNTKTIKTEQTFFNNKIISEIIDNESEYPLTTRMITDKTKLDLNTKFDEISTKHLVEQNNIDVSDILKFSTISLFILVFIFTLIGSFTPSEIKWNHISIFEFFLNIENSLKYSYNIFSLYMPFSIGFIPISLLATFGIKKLLASSKTSILRFLPWYITTVLLFAFLLTIANTQLIQYFEIISFDISNIQHSFLSLKSILFDLLIVSSLAGMLKARQVNCFKMKNITSILKSSKLAKKLGY
jgi:hypothetical protein